MNLNTLLDDFAIRSFRDQADGDYISARMASRARLVNQFLWASQQAMEKYLKCILLLNRIPAANVRHNLEAAIKAIAVSRKIQFELTPLTKEYIEYMDSVGVFRYLEVSNFVVGRHLILLDRAVWELRRYCTHSKIYKEAKLRKGTPAPNIRLPGGRLEKIIDSPENPARGSLTWRNAFFGTRTRKKVRVNDWFEAHNAPLSLHPEILDEVLKYVFLPRELERAIRAQNPLQAP